MALVHISKPFMSAGEIKHSTQDEKAIKRWYKKKWYLHFPITYDPALLITSISPILWDLPSDGQSAAYDRSDALISSWQQEVAWDTQWISLHAVQVELLTYRKIWISQRLRFILFPQILTSLYQQRVFRIVMIRSCCRLLFHTIISYRQTDCNQVLALRQMKEPQENLSLCPFRRLSVSCAICHCDVWEGNSTNAKWASTKSSNPLLQPKKQNYTFSLVNFCDF